MQHTKELAPRIVLMWDDETGIARIENYLTELGHAAHPNIKRPRSAEDMKRRGAGGKDDRVVQSHSFLYNIAWPKAARRAIANANLHCPRQDEDILAARGDVPVTKVVGGKTPKDDIGAGLNRHILDVGGGDMQVFERMAGCSAFGTSVSGNAAVLVISPASIAFTTSAA